MNILPHPAQSLAGARKELENLLSTDIECCFMLVLGSQYSNIAQLAQAESERAPNRAVVWLQADGIIDAPSSSSPFIAWTITDALLDPRKICQLLPLIEASSPAKLQEAFLKTQAHIC